MGMTDLASLDPNAYIEPMELYDSIFWGRPLPSRHRAYLGFQADHGLYRITRPLELGFGLYELRLFGKTPTGGATAAAILLLIPNEFHFTWQTWAHIAVPANFSRIYFRLWSARLIQNFRECFPFGSHDGPDRSNVFWGNRRGEG